MNDSDIRYNQVRQKSSHNSYQRKEGYPDQALYWRIRSMEIDIHNSNNGAGWPQLNGNWYVYHASVVDQSTSVNTFSDALDVLAAFHTAVPDHEPVTIWVDLKDDFVAGRDQTPASMDRLIADRLGRDNIWGPPDLIGSQASLQQAVAAYGWPVLADLQGKFIFGCTTGDLSSPDSVLNQYVDNGATANQRLAFVAPQISRAADINRHDYAAIFNLSSGNASLARDVFDAGFISRVYGLNSSGQWAVGWENRANHLGTDKVNTFEDGWARTDLAATGYPFTGIDVTLDPDLTEPGQLYAIKVDSGDIWNNRDSFFFQYNTVDTAAAHTLAAFTANPQSHVDGWIKGGIMARAGLSDAAPYIAVFQTGEKEIRMQFRTRSGNDSKKISVQIPDGVNGKPVVGNNTPIWFRLDIAAGGTSAKGSYSIDGSEWIPVGNADVDQPLDLQGLAAASHGSGQVKWLFGGMDAPAQGQAIGSNASGSFIADSAEAASLGPYT
ncbi:MAG: Ca2+-dependent phosphoinositide-specific phospholipase C [Desulfobacter sp.]